MLRFHVRGALLCLLAWGCGDGSASGARSEDAGRVQDTKEGGVPEAGAPGDASGLLPDCASAIPGQTGNVVKVALPTLCDALAERSAFGCPTDRTSLLEKVGERCHEGGFPNLVRSCGLDRVPFEHPEGWRADWAFDSKSGELVGAWIELDDGWCGRAIYLAGRYEADVPDGECGLASVCPLCLSGSERDAACPPEVLEVLPGKACTVPEEPPGCDVTCDLGPGQPEQGAPCGDPLTCEPCWVLFCGWECVCTLDGVMRWQPCVAELEQTTAVDGGVHRGRRAR